MYLNFLLVLLFQGVLYTHLRWLILVWELVIYIDVICPEFGTIYWRHLPRIWATHRCLFFYISLIPFFYLWAILDCFSIDLLSFFVFFLIYSHFSSFVFLLLYCVCILIMLLIAFLASRMGFPGWIDRFAVQFSYRFTATVDMDGTTTM